MSTRPNLLAPDVYNNPYPLYSELQERAPVCQVDPLGMWMVTRYEDCLTVLKDPQRFSSAKLEMTVPPWYPFSETILRMDPPQHAKFRNLVNRGFATQALTRLEPEIRRFSEELATRVLSQRRVDFVKDFALPLPAFVITKLLGADPSIQHRLKAWSDDLLSVYLVQHQPEREAEVRKNCEELARFARELVEDHRRTPRSDMVSDMIQAEVDGQRLSDDELTSFVVTLLVGGLETTTQVLANTLLTLSTRQELLDRVRAQPALIPRLVEEVLRFEPAVHFVARYATTDVELSGGQVSRGTTVLAAVGAASRDPRQFQNPHQFDIDRERHGSLPFGHGPHFCMGAALARLEARIGLEALLPRLRSYTLTDGNPIQWSSLLVTRGPSQLPLELTPA